MPVRYSAVSAIQPHVSTAAMQMTHTPLSEAISECELAQTHGAPTYDRPGTINGPVPDWHRKILFRLTLSHAAVSGRWTVGVAWYYTERRTVQR